MGGDGEVSVWGLKGRVHTTRGTAPRKRTSGEAAASAGAFVLEPTNELRGAFWPPPSVLHLGMEGTTDESRSREDPASERVTPRPRAGVV